MTDQKPPRRLGDLVIPDDWIVLTAEESEIVEIVGAETWRRAQSRGVGPAKAPTAPPKKLSGNVP